MVNVKLIFVVSLLSLAGIVTIQQRRINAIKEERDRYEQNSTAMLSQMEQWQIDSTTMATNVKALRFNISELNRYRAEDLQTIKDMKVKIQNLQATAKHEIEVQAKIEAPLRDTIIIRDTIQMLAKSVTMKTPHISLDGVIAKNQFKGSINLPVTLNQAVWVEYKRVWLFWKKTVAVNQTITTDNPHVKIKYSEYIKIE